MNFFKTPKILKLLYPDLIWDRFSEGKSFSDKKIFLTFDDGPVPEMTDFVLETLHYFKAKATFFCVGENIQKHPEIFNKIIYNRHAIGNHTFNHLNGWNTPNQIYFENVQTCEQAINQHIPELNRKVKLFRPPYGKVKKAQAKALTSNFSIVMWDILSGDFDRFFNENTCLKKCIAHTRSGSIIVFHDSYKAEKNLKSVLPRYLAYFTRQGFIFPTL